jgi:23S rRNA maturation-related 3'-5' exoribonuclease YhaM
MADLFDLSAKVSVDAAGVDTSLSDLQRKAQDLTRSFSELDKSVGSFGGKLQTHANHAANAATHTASASRETNKLAEGFRALSSSVVVADGPLGGIASRLRAVGAEATELGDLFGPVGIGLGAIAIGAGVAGLGLLELVKETAQTESRFQDLNQQTGFSVETLSALSSAAKLSGGNIETVAAALGIFQRHMETANQESGKTVDKLSGASRAFRILSIDTQDNEKALRQTFEILNRLPAGAQQSALSMELFGRSGREVTAIFKETHGNLDQFISKLRDEGILVTAQAAEQGDKLHDSMTLLGEQFEATGRSVAHEFAPMVADALASFSSWLRDNQKELVSAAKDVAALISDISSLASFIASISPIVLQVKVIRSFISTGSDGGDIMGMKGTDAGRDTSTSTVAGRFMDWWSRGRDTGTNLLGAVDMSKVQNQTSQQIAATAKANADAQKKQADDAANLKSKLDSLAKPSGGGGRGGGGKSHKDELDSLRTALIAINEESRKYQEQLDGIGKHSRETADQEKFLSAILKDLPTQTRLQISQIADVHQAIDTAISKLPPRIQEAARQLYGMAQAQMVNNEEARQSVFVQEKYHDFMGRLRDDLEDEQRVTDKWDKALQALNRELAKEGKSIADAKDLEYQDIIAKLKLIDLLKQEAQAMQQLNITRLRYADILRNTRPRRAGIGENDDEFRVKDLGGGSTAVQRMPKGITPGDVVDMTRPRSATGLLHSEEWLNQVRQIAGQMTSTLDRAVYDGFTKGGRQALIDLGTGALDLFRQKLMEKVQKGIEAALKQVADTGTGILAKVAKFLVGDDVGQKQQQAAAAMLSASTVQTTAATTMTAAATLQSAAAATMLAAAQMSAGGGGGDGGGGWGAIASFALKVAGGISFGGGHGGLNPSGMAAGKAGYATGGSFMVGGTGGTDSQFVGFHATPGERVTIQTPGQQAQGGNVVHNYYHNWNITTRDARSFMSEDTTRQMAQRANRIMQHAALTG